MQNLGSLAAGLTLFILLGNLLTIAQFQPFALKIFSLCFALIGSFSAFLYCSHRFNQTIGWMAGLIALIVFCSVLGIFA